MIDRKIHVVDLSEWTGPVSEAHARCMIEQHGVEGVILQAWGGGPNVGRRNDYFHQAAEAFDRAFKAAGKPTYLDPYCWPPSNWEACVRWIGNTKALMSGAFYLDIEAGAGMNQSHVDGVRAAGWEPRVYVSPSGWDELMGNTPRFSDLKLWLARYLLRFRGPDGYYRPGWAVNFPEDAFGNRDRIGGWTKDDLVGWQTTGTVPDFCDESVDTNIFWESAFNPKKEEEDDDEVTNKEFEAYLAQEDNFRRVEAWFLRAYYQAVAREPLPPWLVTNLRNLLLFYPDEEQD